jgi:hypothetical protein
MHRSPRWAYPFAVFKRIMQRLTLRQTASVRARHYAWLHFKCRPPRGCRRSSFALASAARRPNALGWRLYRHVRSFLVNRESFMASSDFEKLIEVNDGA